MDLKSKFNMTREENFFLANRNMVHYLWNSARLEGIPVTLPQTQEIYSGRAVGGLTIIQTLEIHQLKYGWEMILTNLDEDMSYSFICGIHKTIGDKVVERPGKLKTSPNHIGDYHPPMPIESKIKEEIAEILTFKNATERALTLMTYLMRQQIFSDGNKRTATLAANQILISSGEGVLSVPVNCLEEFSTKTMEFYHSADNRELKYFLYEKCLSGNK